MLTQLLFLNQGTLKGAATLLDINFSSLSGGHSPNLIMGLECVFFIWVIIIAGYMITGISDHFKKTSDEKQARKPLGEIIKDECQMISHKEINLAIFSNGIHCLVDKMLVYLRVKSGEYYIVLNSDKGCLVETAFDPFQANKEFSFICLEDEAAKEGMPVSITRFNYTLFDKNMTKEIIH